MSALVTVAEGKDISLPSKKYAAKHRDPGKRRAKRKGSKAEINHNQQGDGLGPFGHIRPKKIKEN